MQTLQQNLKKKYCLKDISQTKPVENKADSTDDEHSLEELPNTIKKVDQTKKQKKKYKTELCKNYSQSGFCPYRKKCRFAHGAWEMKPEDVMINNKFRTKRCISYWTQGACSYGARCQFSHECQISEQTKFYLAICDMAIHTITESNQCSKAAKSKLLGLLKNESPSL